MLTPLFAALLSGAFPLMLQAQDPDQSREVVVGSVRDASGLPLVDAEVYISQRSSSVRTDRNGVFRIADVRWGDYWLYARKLGYTPARQTLTVQYQKTPREVRLALEMLPVTLSAVEVTAESGFGRGVGSAPWFTQDVKAWGRLITRDRIANTRAPSVSILLRQYIPNFPFDVQQAHRALADGGRERQKWYNFGLPDRFRSVCVPAISVNAGYPMLGIDVDAFAIEDIEALEFFRSNVGTPLALQFQVPQGACGMVRLWVKPYGQVTEQTGGER